MSARRMFELLSTALREARPNGLGDRADDWRTGWQDACEAVADALAKDNRAFDRERFLKDCGVTK